MIRAFVALTLPEDIVSTLVAAQAGLPAGRPVAPENLHLTLSFLGEQREPVVEDLHYALQDIRLPAFPLMLSGLDLQGSGRPRALVANVALEPPLRHLREKVMQAARGAGLRLDRSRYTPHVTLARFNQGLRLEEADRMRRFAVAGAGFRAGPFVAESFALIRSHLGRSGPIYQELARYPLEGAGQLA